MAGVPPPATPPSRLRRRNWLRRLATAAVVYLLCWAITWAFAPAANCCSSGPTDGPSA